MSNQVEQRSPAAHEGAPATAVDSPPAAAHLRLYLVYPRGKAVILVAARDDAHARSFPPFANWRMLLKFGGWSPDENRRTRVKMLGLAVAGVEAGPVLFGAE